MIKKPLLHTMAIALLAVMVGTAAFADDASLPTDVFTMTLPSGFAAFTKQVQTSKSPEGEIEITNWISKAPTGEAVVVTMSRMPKKILDPQKLISSTRESLVKSLGGTLESEEPLLFSAKGTFLRAQLTVVDDRVYQLLYVGRSAEQRSAATVAEMFQGFKIAEK
jgi:hypothetical protein